MPPKTLRKKKSGDVSSVDGDGTGVSDMEVEGVSAALMPPPAGRRLRHTESEQSSDGGEESKRQKLGSPLKAGGAAGVGSAISAGVAAAVVVGSGREPDIALSGSERVGEVQRSSRSRAKRAAPKSAGGVSVMEMKSVTDSLLDLLCESQCSAETTREVISLASRYEEMLMRAIVENERLRGKLEAYEGFAAKGGVCPVPGPSSGVAVSQGPALVSAAAPVNVPSAVAPAVRPVETWSVVVKGKKGTSSKEVVKKVVEEVGPTLKVRVHEVKETRDGGAVIRTPSVAERQKIAANTKFADVGLEVLVNDKLGPKVVVQRVHAEISTDDFMQELYDMNFVDTLSPESFRKSVRLASGPWRSGANESKVNVVLECTERVAEKLCAEGAYIKWFRFIVRRQDPVPSCYRCLGFDHRVRECRMKSDICRRCGVSGHVSMDCPNPVRCRNCELKGLPAGHLMLSSACPVYAALTARANARH